MTVKSLLLVIAVAIAGFAALPAAGDRAASRLPGATTWTACAAGGPYWPTQTLALGFGAAWVACKEERRLLRIPHAGAARSIPLRGGEVIAVAAGLGSIWTLDTNATLSRIAPSSRRVVARIELGAARPYNLWVGAGSVWSVDDATGEVIRVDPATRRIVARIAVGDGPSDIVFQGTSAWIVNHRDRGLVLLDTRTNTADKLATLPGDAPERIALLGGSLWITGRGTDLIEADPATGAVRRTIEIGAGGIDVVAGAGSLWVPVRTAAVDRRGFPTMATLRRIRPDGSVTTAARATKPIDVHGLAADATSVWLTDTTNGVLYRLPAR